MPALLLIADDDPLVRSGLGLVLRSAGHRVAEAGSGREVIELAESDPPDLVFLDLDMPEGTGMEVLPQLLALDPAPAVVILTGYVEVRTAVQAMQMGAANLLEKPVQPDALLALVDRVLAGRRVAEERDRLREEISVLRSGPMIGESPAIRRVLHQVQRVAQTPRTTVLITGESGVGKELVARAVHEHSGRKDGPFVAVNCAALSEGLLEAELFGYEPGAFTGGNPKGSDGLVAAAAGGTLFLDEIGELALHLQSKLLRVLQERTYRRVSGTLDLEMDARVVAASNRDLVAMVEEGTFREDLFYRVNVLSIHVPPLRERRGDVAPLANHFLAQCAQELGRPLQGFTDEALELLEKVAWPGNVRELRNGIERAAILAQDDLIRPEHLGLGPVRGATAPAEVALSDNRLKTLEAAHIARVIAECTGNRSQAARELGINRTTLYNKLRAYGIEG